MTVKKNKTSHRVICSFCKKKQDEVKKIIAGPGVYICDECVELCNNIIEDPPNEKTPSQKKMNLATPEKIKKDLDAFVIGQEYAKKVLAVAVYNHYKRTQAKKSEIEIRKSNILLVGPTGSGKTLLASTLAKSLNVPFAIADATSLTEAGYVGEDVENILLSLLRAADFDIEKAERGIIYIDEIDKISKKGENRSITRDVSGEGVQQALLKIIEGTIANIPPTGGRKHPNQEYIKLNTGNILFIVGGAFSGLTDIIKERVGNRKLGFGSSQKVKTTTNQLLHLLQPEDLLRYGLIPEFIGRLPMTAHLDELTKDELLRILTEPKDALIAQYQYLFELDGIALSFEQKSLEAIVEKTFTLKTGARGLRRIIESALLETMFSTPSEKESISKIVVTQKVITDGNTPTIRRKKKTKVIVKKTKKGVLK